jgi:hypothetical protein
MEKLKNVKDSYGWSLWKLDWWFSTRQIKFFKSGFKPEIKDLLYMFFMLNSVYCNAIMKEGFFLFPKFCSHPNYFFVWIKTLFKLSEPYDNPFWEKSKWSRRKKKTNAVNSGHLVPWQHTKVSRINICLEYHQHCRLHHL